MQDIEWELLAVIVLALALYAYARCRKYCCLREQDDSRQDDSREGHGHEY